MAHPVYACSKVISICTVDVGIGTVVVGVANATTECVKSYLRRAESFDNVSYASVNNLNFSALPPLRSGCVSKESFLYCFLINSGVVSFCLSALLITL